MHFPDSGKAVIIKWGVEIVLYLKEQTVRLKDKCYYMARQIIPNCHRVEG